MSKSFSKRIEALEFEGRVQEFGHVLNSGDELRQRDPERIRFMTETECDYGEPPDDWAREVDWQAFCEAFRRLGYDDVTVRDLRKEVWTIQHLEDLWARGEVSDAHP